MVKLLIRTDDGTVYEARLPTHSMVVEYHEVDLDTVVAVGFVKRGREVWEDRKPH